MRESNNGNALPDGKQVHYYRERYVYIRRCSLVSSLGVTLRHAIAIQMKLFLFPLFVFWLLPTLTRGQTYRDTAEISRQIKTAKKIGLTYPDSARRILERSITASKVLKSNEHTGKAMLSLASHHSERGSLEQSKKQLLEALPYCQLTAYDGNKTTMAMWNNSFAIFYSKAGYDDTALFFYYRALDELNSKGTYDPGLMGRLYCNIGSAWMEAHQNERSQYYLKKSIVIATAMKDTGLLAINHHNMGCNLAELKRFKLSKQHFLKALQFCEGLGDTTGVQLAYYGLGRIHFLRNELRPARSFFQAAIQINPKATFQNTPMYQGIGGIYFKMNELDSAAFYYHEAARYLKQDMPKSRMINYSALASIYTAQKKYKLANQYQKAYADLKDSIINEEKVKAINTLEVKYNSAEKDKQIAQKQLLLSEQANELKQKNVWLGAISVSSLLFAVSLIALYKSNKQKQKLHSERMRIVLKEQEIGNLKAMMKGEEKERSRLARDLHDGIMVKLSAVKMRLNALPEKYDVLSGTNDYGTILSELDSTTRELRQTAHNLMPDMLLEGGLGEALYYFCKKLQHGTGLCINYVQNEQLPALQQEFEIAIYRIVQELLQNAIKHAKATKTMVQLIYREEVLYITVTDNGTGFSTEQLNASTGFGLKSIRNRLRALNGVMDLQSNEQGTAVYLEFDVQSVISVN